MTEAAPAPGDGLGAAITSNAWLEAIPEDLTFDAEGEGGKVETKSLREHPQIAEFKNPGELAKAFLETKRMVGKKAIGLVQPKEDATDDDRKAFQSELNKMLGVPETPEAYEFGELPKGLEKNEPLEGWFRTLAHQSNLSPAQAKALYDGWNQLMLAQAPETAKQIEAAHKQRQQECDEALGKVWGEKVKDNVTLARRGLQSLAVKAGVDVEDAAKLMQTTGLGENPIFVRLCHAIGKGMSEDELVGDGAPGTPKEKSIAETLFSGYGEQK